jgi:hypothetical protein
MGRPPLDNETRFWQNVKKTKTCWLWQGSKIPKGYGQFHYRLGPHRRRMLKAHVYAYVFYHPKHKYLLKPRKVAGTLVCHSCDVRHCVNPAHLWIGTQFDNIRDMIAKGRKVTCPGEKNGMFGRSPMQGRRHTLASRKKMSETRIRIIKAGGWK